MQVGWSVTACTAITKTQLCHKHVNVLPSHQKRDLQSMMIVRSVAYLCIHIHSGVCCIFNLFVEHFVTCGQFWPFVF